jgi:hypothetical protein
VFPSQRVQDLDVAGPLLHVAEPAVADQLAGRHELHSPRRQALSFPPVLEAAEYLPRALDPDRDARGQVAHHVRIAEQDAVPRVEVALRQPTQAEPLRLDLGKFAS